MSENNKRGYLNENYLMFHIKDKRDVDFESHSHDFHKIILCLSGSVTYVMEGKTYSLDPKQMLFVPKGTIHKSILNSNETYERIVLWINDDYLRSYEEDENSLATCFDMASCSRLCAVTADKNSYGALMRCVTEMESLSGSHLFASKTMRDAYFIQLMVIFNRLMLEQKPGPRSYISDPKFDEILVYINDNLKAELSAEELCTRFFLSRSYLMHRFKQLTGCTLHSYVVQKRLTFALERLKQGIGASAAAEESGFSDYTVFYRNFKKMFGVAPGEITRK